MPLCNRLHRKREREREREKEREQGERERERERQQARARERETDRQTERETEREFHEGARATTLTHTHTEHCACAPPGRLCHPRTTACRPRRALRRSVCCAPPLPFQGCLKRESRVSSSEVCKLIASPCDGYARRIRPPVPIFSPVRGGKFVAVSPTPGFWIRPPFLVSCDQLGKIRPRPVSTTRTRAHKSCPTAVSV